MTIIDKLKLGKYKNMAVLQEPADYHLFDGYQTVLPENHDAIFIFVKTIDEMVKRIKDIIIGQYLLEKRYITRIRNFCVLNYPEKKLAIDTEKIWEE